HNVVDEAPAAPGPALEAAALARLPSPCGWSAGVCPCACRSRTGCRAQHPWREPRRNRDRRSHPGGSGPVAEREILARKGEACKQVRAKEIERELHPLVFAPACSDGVPSGLSRTVFD